MAMDYHRQPDPTEQAATMPAEVNAEWAPSNRWDFWFGKANDCYPKSFPSSMRGSAGQAVGEDPPVPKLNLSAKAPCKGEGSEGAEAQEVRAKAPKVPKLNLAACSVIQGS